MSNFGQFYETANATIAQDYYYFFFLTQPAPIPERLIGGDPRGFMREILIGLTKKDDIPFDNQALEAYLQASTTSEAITAMCECFRAGLSCDCKDDRDDRAVDRKIQCPTLVLWGEKGVVGQYFDMREVWQRWALSASFASMPCGHFIPEEEAEIARKVILEFLANTSGNHGCH